MTETVEYTTYKEDGAFVLWGLAHHGGRDEAAFDTEEEAQVHADAFNAGCNTQEEVEAFIVARLEPEGEPKPEPNPEEWLAKYRQDLAAIRVKIEAAQAEGHQLQTKAQALLSEHGLDAQTVETKRSDLLMKAGIPCDVVLVEERYAALQTQASDLEDLLKEAALNVYALTQEKHLGGVDIKANKMTTLLVDTAKAVEYGLKFLPNMIKTTVTWKNQRSFLSAMRKRLEGEMDNEISSIIELVDDPSAVVAGDLSEYLVEEVPPGFVEEFDIPF